ncbi:uncharacterized protein LOC122643580 [Telopea speciosissima]|uniref:uncharacterized protein LOC122643580 n=1 Tax=Telopea speciosissima TaxID=54955 RepID=UPI001CC4DCE7|nr:uncharacterized protein LOC122643580 [Telopea speciosissima]
MVAWGMETDAMCVLCKSAAETLDHLFFQCSYSAKLWKSILALTGYSRGPLTSWQAEISWLVTHFQWNTLLSKVRRFSFVVLVYKLWGERNNRIFKGGELTAGVILRQVMNDTRGRFSGGKWAASDDNRTRDFFATWGIQVHFGAIGRIAAGQVLFATAGGFCGDCVLKAELEAIRCGMAKAKDMGIPQIQVRSYSKCVVQMITGLYTTHLGTIWD